MIGKRLSKGLTVFYIVNIILALILFILSISDLFFPEPSSLTSGSVALFILMRIPFYFSLIPLLIFLMRKWLPSIFVGITTVLWIAFIVFIFFLIVFMYSYGNDQGNLTFSSARQGAMIISRVFGILILLYIFWFFWRSYLQKPKKIEKGKTDTFRVITWLFGLGGIILGLFFLFLVFIALIYTPELTPLRILLAIVGFIVAFLFLWSGYAFTRRAGGHGYSLLKTK